MVELPPRVQQEHARVVEGPTPLPCLGQGRCGHGGEADTGVRRAWGRGGCGGGCGGEVGVGARRGRAVRGLRVVLHQLLLEPELRLELVHTLLQVQKPWHAQRQVRLPVVVQDPAGPVDAPAPPSSPECRWGRPSGATPRCVSDGGGGRGGWGGPAGAWNPKTSV